jgi:probable HAF family extracellular repeat protein
MRATMWVPGAGSWTQVDLNAQLPAGSVFWHLSDAFDINESGQIVGLGAVDYEGQTHAFLLTPVVPEPPVWLLMGLGVVGLALRRLGWPGTRPLDV